MGRAQCQIDSIEIVKRANIGVYRAYRATIRVIASNCPSEANADSGKHRLVRSGDPGTETAKLRTMRLMIRLLFMVLTIL
jgi:hypothetical protein